VTALEEEIANELLKMVGNRGKGNAQGSPDLDEGRSITPKPSRPTLTQIFVVRPVSLLGMVTLLHVQESKAHLLVAALHAAVPLKQVHSIAKLSILGIVALLHVQESKAHLLVAALHAAVPLKEVHGIAELISKDLDFNVARPLDEPLQQNALISEGCSSLPLG